MKKSPFETWYTKQFGRCPMSNTKGLSLEKKLMETEREASRIRCELIELREWHSNERAARYAWNAKEVK